MLEIDEVIERCEQYQEVLDQTRGHYYDGSYPAAIIEHCRKLRIMGLKWGDKLPSGHFRLVHGSKFYITNSGKKFHPDVNEYYIEWDNGNIGRLQFVRDEYWGDVTEEWEAFREELMSYDPVDYDPLNCRIFYNIENGKRVMEAYKDICDRTATKMRVKIRQADIKKKQAELEMLLASQEAEK